MLGFVYERLGRYEESINALNRSLELMAGSTVPVSAVGYVLAASGRRDEARAILEHLKKLSEERYVSSYFFAWIYTGLGDRDAAFKCLEKAVELRDEWLIWLGTDPWLDYLRDDPRFTDLLARVGLKEEKVAPISYSGSPGFTARHVSGTSPFGVTQTGPSTDKTPSLTDAVHAVYRDHRRERAWMLAGAALLVLAAAFFGYRALVKPAARFVTTKIEKLTASGNVINAAISRDGKYAAYVMDEVGKQGIWVRQMAVANSIRIVPPAETEYRGLTFSNDGTYVYYVVPGTDGGAGVLYQVPALGGSVTEVRRGVDSPIGFSPDGTRYAFIRNNASGGEDALMISEQNGSGEQRLATRKYPEHFSTATAPAWSPDGSTMACVTQTADANGFFMKLTELRLSDRTERELLNKRWQEIGQTAWIPDGTALIITGQDSSSGFLHLWRVSYPGGELRRITNDPSDYRGVSLPASSDVLVTVQRQTLTSIFIAPKGDPGNPRPVTSGAGRFFDLIWTPEGGILYASDASGAADVWEMEADGTGQKQLTAGAGRNYGPAVTQDGRYVFFHSNRSGSWQIWRMERDGSNAVQMTKGQEESNWPDVSPDGKWMVYQHNTAGTPTVWRMPVSGGAASQVTSGLSMRPAISPDGRSIAVWEKEDKPNAPWKIAIVPFDGGAAIRLLDVPQSPATANSVIHWTQDGNGVLFIDFRNGVTNLMLQSFDSSPPKQLTKFTKEQFYSFDFSADGRVLLSRGFWTNDVVLISEAN